MKIKRVYRNNKELDDTIFSSFKEVFDYCLSDLTKSAPKGDCIMYQFKILDTDEIFCIVGQPKGDDATISMHVDFRI